MGLPELLCTLNAADPIFVELTNLSGPRLQSAIAISVGCIVAVFLGIVIGGGNFDTLARVVAIAVLLLYLLFWQKYSWKIGLTICLLDFSYFGLGFQIGGTDQSMLLAGILIIVTCWRKARLPTPAVFETGSFGVFNFFLLAWLIYSVGHLVFNHLDPFRPSDYALKNFLKTFVQFSGPAGLIFYFMHRPRGVVVGSSAPRSIAVIGISTLVLAICIKLWEFSQGLGGASDLNPLAGESLGFTIPSLSLAASLYTLRGVPIFLAPLAAVFAKTKWLREQPTYVRVIFFAMPPLCILGAMMSGGRATIAFVIILLSGAHALRGRISVILKWGTLLFVLVLGVNFAGPMIRTSPAPVQRSLSWALVTQANEGAVGSIASSTNWRLELFNRSLEEWDSDRRIFWFGRGVYAYTIADEIAMRQDGYEGTLETSRRRGATHNLLTDLLVTYGLCGAVLYLGAFVGLVFFLWSVFRAKMADEVGRNLALSAFLLSAFGLIYGLVGGGGISPTLAWLVVATLAYFYRLQSAGQPRAEFGLPNTKSMIPRRQSSSRRNACIPGVARHTALWTTAKRPA